jgi:hypothetical protein
MSPQINIKVIDFIIENALNAVKLQLFLKHVDIKACTLHRKV